MESPMSPEIHALRMADKHLQPLSLTARLRVLRHLEGVYLEEKYLGSTVTVEDAEDADCEVTGYTPLAMPPGPQAA